MKITCIRFGFDPNVEMSYRDLSHLEVAGGCAGGIRGGLEGGCAGGCAGGCHEDEKGLKSDRDGPGASIVQIKS